MTQQFAVHRSPGRSPSIPFVVNVQSNRFERASRCVVVPLVETRSFGAIESDIGPRFRVENVDVVLDPLQITNVPRRMLGGVIVVLLEDADRITAALDALLSKAWR